MAAKLPAIKPYWDDDCGTNGDFKSWFQVFKGWLQLHDIGAANPLNDLQKDNMLLVMLGREGIRVFQSNPVLAQIENTSFEDFDKAVKGTFVVTVNPVKSPF